MKFDITIGRVLERENNLGIWSHHIIIINKTSEIRIKCDKKNYVYNVDGVWVQTGLNCVQMQNKVRNVTNQNTDDLVWIALHFMANLSIHMGSSARFVQ